MRFAPTAAAAAAAFAALMTQAPVQAQTAEDCGGIELTSITECHFEFEGGCKANCQPLNFTAACDGECNISLDAMCTADCQGSCEAECDVDPAMFSCEASCRTDCEATIDSQCGSDQECRNYCEADCASQCHQDHSHPDAEIDKHGRLACPTCHIPEFARGHVAGETVARRSAGSRSESTS